MATETVTKVTDEIVPELDMLEIISGDALSVGGLAVDEEMSDVTSGRCSWVTTNTYTCTWYCCCDDSTTGTE